MSRYKDPFTQQEAISFFCIDTNLIEHFQFDAETMVQVHQSVQRFPFANFKDFYVTDQLYNYERAVIILSEELNESNEMVYYR